MSLSNMSDKKRKKIISLYNEGYGHMKIMKKVHISQLSLYKIIKEENLIRDRIFFKRQNSVNDNYFDKINNEKAWLIGLLAADGCVYKSKNKPHTIYIGQAGNNGLKLIKYIKSILNFSGKIYKIKYRTIKHKKNYKSTLDIPSAKLTSELEKYNIVPRKSLIYEFPYKLLPFLYSFLRGYIDGDGCVGVYSDGEQPKKYITIDFVGTKSFIYKCQEFISVKGCIMKMKQCRNCYRLRFSYKKAIEFGKLIYSDKKLFKSYKYKKFIQYLEYEKKYENKKTNLKHAA